MTTVHDSVERIDVDPVNKAESRKLYAARTKVFPKRVRGTFRSLKWAIMVCALTIYYVTPWLRWARGEHAPDQAVLVDMAHRRFYFFFIEIWPQEFYYVAGLLVMAGIGLFLVTSTIGRAWCGYTCPQTVWVDLFLVVERAVEGDRNARIKLDKAPWSANKIVKRAIKHSIWLVIAMATGGAWIFYFADAPKLAIDVVTLSAPMVAYTTIAILTATTYIFAGFMREQVCTYMCPWPRIQAAMLDEHSLVVTYNDWRGEPRGRHRKKAAAQSAEMGDCVDCQACVAVCPQGIDIRDGQQMECITCALCIDACNDIMTKVGKPTSLISYSTLNDYNHAVCGEKYEPGWRSFIRPRTYIYILVFSCIGLTMLVSLLTRSRLDMYVLHDRSPQYVQMSDGSIRNGYQIKILNMRVKPRRFNLSISGLADADLFTVGNDDGKPSTTISLDVAADAVRSVKVFVRANPKTITGDQGDIVFTISDQNSDEETSYTSSFQVPVK